ncbi:MAG: serine kinase [Chloroflexota bacterium]
MYAYAAYNLGIQSEIALPELIPAPGASADVTIRIGAVTCDVARGVDGQHISPCHACMTWDGFGAYCIRDGREIVVAPAPGAATDAVRAPILGIGLAMLLVQRGLFVLHASAVDCGGVGVAFVGEKGFGKSTMAATMFGRGHPMLTDDVLVVDDLPTHAEPLALPAFPQFKLLPEAAISALGEDPLLLPRLTAAHEKRVRRAHERFARQAVPLGRIYTLAQGPELAIVPLPAQVAALQLVGHSIAGRYRETLSAKGGAAAHLRRCIDLLKRVQVFRLERPFELDRLSLVAEMVERHRGATTGDLVALA